MPYKKQNPYPRHTFHHFAWNVYGLIVYQFGRFAAFAWAVLVLAIVATEYKQTQLNDKLNNQIKVNKDQIKVNKILIKANNQRIADIQASRVYSCEQTYLSIQQVFKPFYPPKKVRTSDQRVAVKKFENLIKTKKSKCKEQVAPK